MSDYYDSNYDPSVKRNYTVVAPEDIKLVHDKHICNPNPNFNDDGQYIGDYTEAHGKNGLYYMPSFISGYKETTPFAGPYLGNRMPRVNAYDGYNAFFGLFENNAITGVFGGPDADLVKPHVEEGPDATVYDENGGTPSYWPEGLQLSTNGISLGSFVNGGSYVKAWGNKTHIGGTIIPQAATDYISNNKMIRTANRLQPEGIPYAVHSQPEQTGSPNPGSPGYDHMDGDGGISFGQFAHSTPDVPEILQSFGDDIGSNQSPPGGSGPQDHFPTRFTKHTTTSISSQEMHEALVMFEYKLDAELATRVFASTNSNTAGTGYEAGRAIEVNLWTMDGNRNGYADNDTAQITGSPTDAFTKTATRKILWRNFEVDDVTMGIRTSIDCLEFNNPNNVNPFTVQGDITPHFSLSYRFFDALDGEWSDWSGPIKRDHATYKSERLDDFLPFGFFCPSLKENDDKYAISGIAFMNLFGIYKSNFGQNWSASRGTPARESYPSRTFMITCLQVRIGIGGTANSVSGGTAGNYVQLGGANTDFDCFNSSIKIDFPFTPAEKIHGVGSNGMIPGANGVKVFSDDTSGTAHLEGFIDENSSNYIFSSDWDDNQDNTGAPYPGSLYKQEWHRKRLTPEGAKSLTGVPDTYKENNLPAWLQGKQKATSGYAFPIGGEEIKTKNNSVGKRYQLKCRYGSNP